ncbi:kelch-like protein 24 [Branchiostoma floridae]|uniref:Kelch-like protein 24 n=1 Tax=Branchiostoma floridae TaxID=7739 RepID=A0A9J7MCQ5_BRAFL|nr:kelch-like protein 24 [Branchiostoma floridae]XP_035698494.1 kelch-like protein 24 [Branchiostoma floridae]
MDDSLANWGPGDHQYPPWFLNRLEGLRSEGLMFDVTLCAEGREIPCHRLVLSAYADYFHAMFCGVHSESKKDRIEILGVSAEALQQLVDYAYTSRITITTDNIQPLYEAANMLQIWPVEQHCERFLIDHMSPQTCLGIWVLTDKMLCTYLAEMARSYAAKYFEEVRKMEEFLELPVNFLQKLIKYDDLYAKKEEEVVEAVMLWARHDLKERQKHLKELLEYVRFSHLDPEYLKNIIETDKEFAEATEIIKELSEGQSTHARSCQTFQGEILLLGGISEDGDKEDEDHNDMYRLDVFGNCVDTTTLPVFFERSRGFAACVLGSDVIVTGGTWSMRMAWRYSSSLNTWTFLPLLREKRCLHQMAVLQGQVYVVGGLSYEEGFPTDLVVRESTEVYDATANSWNEAVPLKQAVSDFGIANCGEKLYVFGGSIALGRGTDLVQCYDPTQEEWTFVSPLPTPQKGVTACTINILIFMVGGWLDCVLCYDPKEDSYTEMTEPLVPWDLSSATLCGHEIYITGGYNHATKTTESTVQCFNASCGTMIVLKDSMPISLQGHCSVTIPKT